MATPVVDCRALEVGYAAHAMLPPIDVDIEPGEFCVVVGRNGSGKSTWLKTVLGILPPVAGQVVHAPGARVAYIPQRYAFDPIFPLTVRDVVGMGVLERSNFLGLPWGDRAALQSAMEDVDAWKLRDQAFQSLSEGQKQRVLLARALASRPDVAFMDEPTAAMDVVAERDMMLLVDQLRRSRNMAVVMVTHELSVATHYAQKVFLVDRSSRTVLEGTPREVFSAEAFAELYGHERATQLLEEIEHVNCEVKPDTHTPGVHDHAHGHGPGASHEHSHSHAHSHDDDHDHDHHH